MYKKYSKIKDLAYLKRKVKIARYHLTNQDYTGFFEMNDTIRSDYQIQYDVSALDLIYKLNKRTKVLRNYPNHFRCSKCFKLRNKSQSYGNKGTWCIPCNKIWRKDHYYGGYKERAIKLDKKWAKINRKKVNDKTTKWMKKEYKTNPIFKLCCLVRGRTQSLFKQNNWKKNKRFKDYIGCSPKELGEHIESQFKGSMTWKNHGAYWQLDHIVAIGLNSKTPEDVYRLNHYSNLQPLTIKQHKKKTKEDMKRK